MVLFTINEAAYTTRVTVHGEIVLTDPGSPFLFTTHGMWASTKAVDATTSASDGTTLAFVWGVCGTSLPLCTITAVRLSVQLLHQDRLSASLDVSAFVASSSGMRQLVLPVDETGLHCPCQSAPAYIRDVYAMDEVSQLRHLDTPDVLLPVCSPFPRCRRGHATLKALLSSGRRVSTAWSAASTGTFRARWSPSPPPHTLHNFTSRPIDSDLLCLALGCKPRCWYISSSPQR